MASKSKTKTASKAKAKTKAIAKTASKSSFRLNPPKKTTFWAAVIAAAVGLVTYILHIAITHFGFLPIAKQLSATWLSPLAFLLLVVGFVLLVLGLVVKGF